MRLAKHLCAIPSVLPHSTTFCPAWPRSAVLSASHQAERLVNSDPGKLLPARVEGHTTPSTADIGAASLRLRFFAAGAEDSREMGTTSALKDGGYLMAIRIPGRGGRFLPAAAGVPGRQGLDRHGGSRVGLAECCIIARPVTDGTATLVPDAMLREWAPVGTPVEVVLLARVTDFFLGLNAGTWLRIRIGEIMIEGQRWVQAQADACDGASAADEVAMLSDTGFFASAEVKPGIEDSTELFHFWGGSGNAGMSGQVIRLPEGAQQLPSERVELD